jgi:DNA-binding transcriptional LysR family regulator
MRPAEQISRRLKLRQLEVLLAVAQSGSMARAAEALSITQPVVSKTIAELEDTLGVRLFDRSTRGIEPTLYGRALLKRSAAIFNDLMTSVSELEALTDPGAGHLRIGSSEAVAAGMLGAIIDRLSMKHPRLTFEVTLGAGLTDLPYAELQSHGLDLIIGRLPSAIPDDVKADNLYSDQVFVLAGTQHPLASRRKISLSSLVDEQWCLPSLETYPWNLTADAFKNAGVEPPRRIVTTRSIMLLTSLVATGRYLTILPQTVVRFCAKTLQLKVLPVDLAIEPYAVGIATLKTRTPAPAVQLFIEYAREITESCKRR